MRALCLARPIRSWRNWHRRGNESGFSLLEMIVAMAILSTAIVGLLSLIALSVGNAARVADYDRAAMLARTQINELRLLDPVPLNTPLSGEWEDGWKWEAVAAPFQVPTPPAVGSEMLVRFELEMSWTGADGLTSRVVEGYGRVRIRPEHASVLGL